MTNTTQNGFVLEIVHHHNTFYNNVIFFFTPNQNLLVDILHTTYIQLSNFHTTDNVFLLT